MSLAMIRGMAKSLMKGKRLLLTAGFVLLLTTWVIGLQILTGLFRLPSLFDFIEAFLDGALGLNTITLLFPVLLILLLIFADLLHMSYRWFGLDILSDESVDIKDVFQGFQKQNIKRFSSLVSLRFIIVLGWSLLFVLPGVWKAYMFSQAANLMKVDASLTPMEALNKSEEVMKGNGWKYALLQSTFALWYAVPIALYVFFIVSNLNEIRVGIEMGPEGVELIFALLISVLFMLGLLLFVFSLYVEPYKMMTKQVFFNELMNHKQVDAYDDYEKVLLKRQGLDPNKNSTRNRR